MRLCRHMIEHLSQVFKNIIIQSHSSPVSSNSRSQENDTLYDRGSAVLRSVKRFIKIFRIDILSVFRDQNIVNVLISHFMYIIFETLSFKAETSLMLPSSILQRPCFCRVSSGLISVFFPVGII